MKARYLPYLWSLASQCTDNVNPEYSGEWCITAQSQEMLWYWWVMIDYVRRIRLESQFCHLIAVHLQNSFLISLSYRALFWKNTCLMETFWGFNREIMCVKENLIDCKFLYAYVHSLHRHLFEAPYVPSTIPALLEIQRLKSYNSFPQRGQLSKVLQASFGRRTRNHQSWDIKRK